MVVRIFENRRAVSQACATLIAAQVIRKPESVLGLATGSSPVGTYQQLIEWYQQGLLDFSQCISFNLDEYIGLDESNPCSYHAFMKEELFNHINMKSFFLPNGNAKNLGVECRRYDKAIAAAGGVDLQLLGIGRNGHIGFNEPDSHFVKGTQVVSLTQSTIEANRRYFDSEDQVPKKAISMGIGTIMSAKEIILIAMGEDKADAIYKAVKGKISPDMPASSLALHPHVTFLVDQAAASRL